MSVDLCACACVVAAFFLFFLIFLFFLFFLLILLVLCPHMCYYVCARAHFHIISPPLLQAAEGTNVSSELIATIPVDSPGHSPLQPIKATLPSTPSHLPEGLRPQSLSQACGVGVLAVDRPSACEGWVNFRLGRKSVWCKEGLMPVDQIEPPGYKVRAHTCPRRLPPSISLILFHSSFALSFR